MPRPIVTSGKHDYSTDCDCDDCILEMRRLARQHAALMHGGYPPPRELQPWWRISANTIICSSVIAACLVAVVLLWPSLAHARQTMTPKPIQRPVGLLQAKRQCSRNTPLVECRAALRRALAAIEWQRHERLHQGAYGVQHALRLASALYSVPLSELRSVSACESHQHADSKNRSSTASGLFQFLDSTWNRAGVPGFSVFDPYANAIAAARLVTRDHGWHEWSCQP